MERSLTTKQLIPVMPLVVCRPAVGVEEAGVAARHGVHHAAVLLQHLQHHRAVAPLRRPRLTRRGAVLLHRRHPHHLYEGGPHHHRSQHPLSPGEGRQV